MIGGPEKSPSRLRRVGKAQACPPFLFALTWCTRREVRLCPSLRLLHKKVVILRESGVSSTLRLFDFIAGVCRILDHPLSRMMTAAECAADSIFKQQLCPNTRLRDLAACSRELCHKDPALPKSEGAGNAGRLP